MKYIALYAIIVTLFLVGFMIGSSKKEARNQNELQWCNTQIEFLLEKL